MSSPVLSSAWMFLVVLRGDGLAEPFSVADAHGPIDVAGGHASPCFHDVDGDGLADLLLGQFDEGGVRLYRNVGQRGAPRFEGFTFVRAGEARATVPYG